MVFLHTCSPSAIQYGYTDPFAPSPCCSPQIIQKCDPNNINDFDDSVEDPQPGTQAKGPEEGQLADGVPGVAERQEVNKR